MRINSSAKELLAAIRSGGLTQEQVAKHTGITQPTISRIERGEVSDVMSRNYRALQDLYRKSRRKQANSAPASTTTAQPATENVAQGV